MTRWKIDPENNSEDWYTAASEIPELAELLARLDDADGIELDAATLERFQTLPGWNDGPEIAPHPLLEIL